MSELLVYGAVIVAGLGGLAGVLHALAAVLRARDPSSAVAAKLEAAEHGLEALVSAAQKHSAGESVFQIALEEAESPEGQAVIQAALERVKAKS